MKRTVEGFTLFELMVTVAIVAILAVVALPSYSEYIKRAHRAAAEAEMMNIANVEQQYFFANKAYADLTASGLNYSIPSEISAYYQCAAVPTAAPSFTIICVPQGSQSADGTLSLAADGTRTRNGSASLW